jgi:hypothetical protein
MRPHPLVLLLLAVSSPAAAETFRIGNRDVPALVRALQTANQTPGPHRIELHPGGIYTLELTDSNGVGLPPLRTRITLAGNGAEIRRYSAARMTLLEVAEGGEARIEALTLAEGSHGAIRNRGRLVLDKVAITDSGSEGAQGIVLNYGRLTLEDCLIGYNQVHKAGRDAGIIYNLGQLTLRRSRFVGNTLTRRGPDPAAAAVLNQGELNADSVEFVANAINDPFEGLAFTAVLNLDNGRASGLQPGQSLDAPTPN